MWDYTQGGQNYHILKSKMKIREIILEEVNSEWLNGPHYVKTYRIGEYNYKVENTLHSGDVPGINVHVTDPSRRNIIIAYAYFILQEDGQDKWLESDETVVEQDYQESGIASTMYSLVRSLGFSIKGSPHQSADGREMWNAWRAKGNDKHLAEGDIVSFKTGKKVTPEPISIRQAFGSEMANSIEDLGVRFAEKPSYWEDLEGNGPYADRAVDELGLKRIQKQLGYRLNTYTTADIYGSDPRGPMTSVRHMPEESVFIIEFSNGKRYLCNKDGARTYIRNWTAIKGA